MAVRNRSGESIDTRLRTLRNGEAHLVRHSTPKLGARRMLDLIECMEQRDQYFVPADCQEMLFTNSYFCNAIKLLLQRPRLQYIADVSELIEQGCVRHDCKDPRVVLVQCRHLQFFDCFQAIEQRNPEHL